MRDTDWLSVERLQHTNETGVRIGGKRWRRSASGRALDDERCMISFASTTNTSGRTVCVKRISCGTALLGRAGPASLAEHLLAMDHAAQQWRRRGTQEAPRLECDEWITHYFEILASGYAAQPPPVEAETIKRRIWQKQSAAKNLLDDLLLQAEQVLAFLDDIALPFTNNLAERDLRMVKEQQKVAGIFRSDAGATAFCRIRSYLSRMHKQGHSMLTALAAVFAGEPLPVAWTPV